MDVAEWNRRTAEGMLESALQSQIVAVAHALNWWEYHTHDSRRSRSGWPDLVLIRGSRMVFAELKRQRERPTKLQQQVLEMLVATGAEVHVWRPLDLFEGRVRAVLEGAGPCPSTGVTSPPTPIGGTAPAGVATRRLSR